MAYLYDGQGSHPIMVFPSFFHQGLKAFHEKRYEDSIKIFLLASEEDKENHQLWNALGVALSKTGDYENANACFQNAIQLSPESKIYQKNIARNIIYLNKINSHPIKKEDKNDKNLKIVLNSERSIFKQITKFLTRLYHTLIDLVVPVLKENFSLFTYHLWNRRRFLIIPIIKRIGKSLGNVLKGFLISLNADLLDTIFGISAGLSVGLIFVGSFMGNSSNPVLTGFFFKLFLISIFLWGLNTVLKKPRISIVFALLGGLYIFF